MKKKKTKKVIINIAIGVGIVLLAAFSIYYFTTLKSYKEISLNQHGKMVENKENFILYIGANSCSACATYKVYLNEVIKDYKVKVYYLDVDKLSKEEHADFKKTYQFSGTPTTIFIKDGHEENNLNRIDGAASYDYIVQKFQKNGYIKGNK